MVRFRQAIVVGVMILLAAACSGDDDASDQALTTSTTVAPSITTLGDGGEPIGTAVVERTTTTTTTTEVPELPFPEYRIVSREATDSGDIVVVLLDSTTYESLSDLDIHNVMSDLVEDFAPVYEAHIVESQVAADALFVEDPTVEQQTALDTAYIARLEEGFRIVYVGRFDSLGVTILGS